MENKTSVLQELHTYLLRIRSVTEEIQEGPKQLKRLEARVAAAEKALADHQTLIKTTKVAIHDREVSVQASRDKIKKHKRDLEGISSKKEYDALNVEIASLEKRASDFDDEGLALLTKVEELTAKTPALEQAIAQVQAVHAKAKAELEKHLPAWKTRLEEAKSLAAERTVLIPPEWRKLFIHIENCEGADSLASMNGKSCSACYTAVTAQQFSMISQGKIEACKSCGKLLYQTNEG